MRRNRDFIYDPSLVLYLPLWKLDGENFMSEDAYGHLCTADIPFWTPQGRLFDGTDDLISLGQPAALKITGNFTFESWVNIDANQGTYKRILSRDDGTNRCYYLHMFIGTPTIAIFTGGTEKKTEGTTDLRGAGSKHVVAINDGTNLIIYVDTVEEISEAKGGAVDDDPADVYIGARSSGSELLKGYIGEVRIYNRALTPLEIQHNYLATKWRYR